MALVHLPRPACRSLRRAALAASAVLVTATALACGPASPGPTSPAPTDTGAPSASAATSSEPAPNASASASATADAAATAAPTAPPKPGVLAADSNPPGASPLNDAEKKELSTKCKKLVDAVAAAAKKGGSKKRPIDYVSEVLASPPKLPGVDVPRCSELMRRDTIAYFARTRESEATLTLKRIMVGLMSSLEHEPPALCASAPAVPKTLAEVKDTPYSSTPADWKAPGWQCARLDLTGALQVFQYELRTDAKAQSYEVIARGYPVQGAAATELYVAGKVEHGAIDMSSPVMRRATP